MLRTLNLSKRLGDRDVLVDVNLKLRRGSIYGLLGENGAGKSTLMRLLIGLQQPTAGEIHFAEGKPPSIGVHIEQPSLYEHLTAREHLEILCLLRSLDFDHISEILQYVELSQAADQRVKTFSLGMKQRLALASPLLGEPELLILDEPTNGLDPRGKRWMRDCIRDLPQRFETTVLLSSHHIHDIQAIVDDVGILHEGTLQLQGSKESLLQKFPDLSSVEDVFFELTTHSHRGRKV